MRPVHPLHESIMTIHLQTHIKAAEVQSAAARSVPYSDSGVFRKSMGILTSHAQG
jgi:hypothetical protein